jgi:hypothetical protein
MFLNEDCEGPEGIFYKQQWIKTGWDLITWWYNDDVGGDRLEFRPFSMLILAMIESIVNG